MTPARVGINLLWLAPGRVGGTEESTLATIRYLAEAQPADLELRLFVTERLRAAHPDLVGALPAEVLRLPADSRPLRVAAEATWLATRTRALDLVHHAGGTAPTVRSAPYVLTLHDLQPLLAAATHGPLKRAYLRATIPPSVRHARSVAVPSEHVRETVLAELGADPAKVVVIPHCVPVPRTSLTPEVELRTRYDLDGPVVLYPAITYPHKDHLTLVRAFARVLDRHPTALLVLPGGVDAAEPALLREIGRLGIGARVRRLGRIDEPDLLGLYGVAEVVAVPSRYEGFGLPAAEAMVRGVALVAAATASLPEVVGDGGVLVPVGDVEAWGAAITDLLSDPGARAELVARGLRRAPRWSGEANAEAHLDLYRRALGSS